MARLCERCQYYSHGNDELTCPTCRIPLRFTLLTPQAGGEAGSTFAALSPAALAAPPPAPPLPTRKLLRARSALETSDGLFDWCLQHRKLMIVLFGLVGLLGLAGYGSRSGTPLTERYDQIEVGMDEEEVIDILDSGGVWSSYTSEFYEIPDDKDETRYTWVWEEEGLRIILSIADGKVVRKSLEAPKDSEDEDPEDEDSEDE